MYIREAARLKGLLAQQAISQREYDTASSDNSVAQAAVQAAQAALRQAELNLSYATVTAPVGGITLNVCSSLRLAICTATCPPRMSWTPWANGRPT